MEVEFKHEIEHVKMEGSESKVAKETQTVPNHAIQEIAQKVIYHQQSGLTV